MSKNKIDDTGPGQEALKGGVSGGNSTNVAQKQLRAFVERIEKLEEEKKGLADDIKDVYAEAKGNGFDTKVLRKVVSIRKQDANERLEQEAVLDLYLAALGMKRQLDDDVV